MKTWAFVPAGGVGSRMRADTPKQYLPLGGVPVLRHAVIRLAMHPAVAGVVVGIAADDRWFGELGDLPIHAVTRAGPTRAATVLAGLDAIVEFADRNDRVLVHDAARPLVRVTDIDRLVAAGAAGEDGALLAMPVTDTVKEAREDGRVEMTRKRDRLWRAATPQLFPVTTLHGALGDALAAGETITDEAAAMERAGYRPILVECAQDNIKITTPEDLRLAEWLLSRQEDVA